MINPKEKIQPNYIIDEFIRVYGVAEATEINYSEIEDIHINRIKTILAPNVQAIRDDINTKFKQENGQEIGLRVNCGFRARKWDIMKNRSGNGTHPIALGVDICPVNCKNDNIYLKIYYYIASRFATHNGGFALKTPEFKDGKIDKHGFIHIDWRGSVARWNY
jgi:hypothetical protein